MSVTVTGSTDSGSVGINHLPSELLVKIFSLLPVEDLALNIPFVCIRWLELSSSDVLWKGSVFTAKDTQTFEYISSFLEKAPKLKCFYMQKSTTEIINNLASYAKDLREITVIDLWDGEDAEEALTNFFTECKNLENITLPGEILHNRNLAVLVGQLENLCGISLRGISLEPITLRTIADGCPALRHLDVHKMAWDYSDLKYFLEKKKNKLLSLRIINVADAPGECALPLIAVCGSVLQKLQLDVFSDTSHPASISEIRQLTGLTSLQISHPRGLTPDQIADVFREKAMSQLVELRIEDSGSEVDSTVVNTICLNCPHLLNLGLKGCYALKDDALQYLHECLNLEELDLFFCISLKGGATEHIFRCENLKYLNIGPWSVLKTILGRLMLQSEHKRFRALSLETAEVRVNLSSLRSRWQKQHMTGKV